MAELFDPQKDSAALQGAIGRLKTEHAKSIAAPSSEPLFHTDVAGNTVDRTGKIVLPPAPPITIARKA